MGSVDIPSILEIFKRLEGFRERVYDDILGYKTVGYGFNLDRPYAREIIKKAMAIDKTFPGYIDLYNGNKILSKEQATVILKLEIRDAVKAVINRSKDLGYDYNSFPFYKKVILLDIQFNTGKIWQWKLVFEKQNPREVLYEARRHPYEAMDSRVAKLGYQLGIIGSLEEANEIGLEYFKDSLH